MNPIVPTRTVGERGFERLPLAVASHFHRRGEGMGIAAVFIDGAYLDKVLLNDFNSARIDYEKLVAKLVEPHKLLRAYYYHCLPHQSDPPTEKEKERYISMQKFLRGLSFLPRFEVRKGYLAYRGDNEKGKPVFQQKGVDSLIAVDMVVLANKGKITDAVLLSGDSDHIPVVKEVKRQGIITTLWHGPLTGLTRPSRGLSETCDQRHDLTRQFLDTIPRPTQKTPE